MPVPTYDQFIEPLLRYLAAHPEGVRAADAHEAVAAQVGLTPEERDERLPSGVQPVYKNRNGWAHDRLKRAGFSTSPRYGFWQLTTQGSPTPRSTRPCPRTSWSASKRRRTR